MFDGLKFLASIDAAGVADPQPPEQGGIEPADQHGPETELLWAVIDRLDTLRQQRQALVALTPDWSDRQWHTSLRSKKKS